MHRSGVSEWVGGVGSKLSGCAMQDARMKLADSAARPQHNSGTTGPSSSSQAKVVRGTYYYSTVPTGRNGRNLVCEPVLRTRPTGLAHSS